MGTGQAFSEAVVVVSDSGAEVHRAGSQERKMDTKWGRENKLRTTSTTWSHKDEMKSVSVPAGSDLMTRVFCRSWSPSSERPSHVPGPGVREAEEDPGESGGVEGPAAASHSSNKNQSVLGQITGPRLQMERDYTQKAWA